MTRARDALHLIAPQRFFTHGQGAYGDRHVYAARTRFNPDNLLGLFDCTAWPAAAAELSIARRANQGVRLDVGSRLRSMWRWNRGAPSLTSRVAPRSGLRTEFNPLRDTEGAVERTLLRFYDPEGMYGSKILRLLVNLSRLCSARTHTSKFLRPNGLLRSGRHRIEFALALLDPTRAEMALYCDADMVRAIARTSRV